jgi:hypothetical protein
MAKSFGFAKLAGKCERDKAYRDKAVQIINAVLAEAHAAKTAATAREVKAEVKAEAPTAKASGPLTDKQAWNMLADLVDSALPELSAEEREALKTAFRDEAKKST